MVVKKHLDLNGCLSLKTCYFAYAQPPCGHFAQSEAI